MARVGDTQRLSHTGRSTMRPSTATAAPPEASRATSTRAAQVRSAAPGLRASCTGDNWRGWMHSRPPKPSRRECRACARQARPLDQLRAEEQQFVLVSFDAEVDLNVE